jgi:hypothetical protein
MMGSKALLDTKAVPFALYQMETKYVGHGSCPSDLHAKAKTHIVG